VQRVPLIMNAFKQALWSAILQPRSACVITREYLFIIFQIGLSRCEWLFLVTLSILVNIGTQVWRRVLPGKLYIQRALMAQLQSWTNALLVLVLCVNQAFVIVLPASNYFLSNISSKFMFKKLFIFLSLWTNTSVCVPDGPVCNCKYSILLFKSNICCHYTQYPKWHVFFLLDNFFFAWV